MPGPNITALEAWAEARGLRVLASRGTQREPENVVAITEVGGAALLSRSSLDSVETAAGYLINTIDRLRLQD